MGQEIYGDAMEVPQFSQKAQEELKYYVYCLVDPRDRKIFYIGKGIGNRVFAHACEDWTKDILDKKIPAQYRQKGAANPFIYQK